MPPLITNNVAAILVSATTKPFSISLAKKLNNDNFLTWFHLATFIIHGQELQDHLDSQRILPRFASIEDGSNNTDSKAYKEWCTDDYNLTSCLFASLDTAFKHFVVECIFAREILSRIHTYFVSQTKARVRQLQLQLKTVKKDGSIANYLLKIKKIVDSLAAVGVLLSDSKYTNVILNGLNEDYHVFITL
nr:uncharacterized protein LOC114927448 [Arachis hypogaea]